MTAPLRDISGYRFPAADQSGGQVTQGVVLQLRPPWFEPPDGSKEFSLAYSLSAPGAGVLTPLFTLDGIGNVTAGVGLQLPPNTQARINNVAIGGDTGAVPGPPQMLFSIRLDRTGQSVLPGWESVGLPSRGGVVTVGFEPFTRITNAGTFLGGFVINNAGGPLYAEMIVTGWYW